MRIDYLPADPAVLRKIAGWLHAEFGPRARGATLVTRAQRIRERARRRAIPLTFVAHESGQAVGTASLVMYDLYSRHDLKPWLASVYVSPPYRRRGFGAALCRRVLLESTRLGFGRLYLFTFDQEKFYASMGWREVEHKKFWGQPITIMVHTRSGL